MGAPVENLSETTVERGESACLEALQGSDGVKAREAKQILIELKIAWLVAHIAKKYRT